MQEKLNNVTTTEAALEIAKEAGFSITAEDLKSHMKQAMSDAELESAAGWTSITVVAGTFVGSIIIGRGGALASWPCTERC